MFSPSPLARGTTEDPLFVGATRPAMVLGVPYGAILANALVTLELFLVTRNLVWLLAAVPVHGLAWLACLAEPRAFELLSLWAQTRARARFWGRHPWGAVSYGAFGSSGSSRAPQIPHAVIDAAELR